MPTDDYRETLINSVNELINMRSALFDSAFRLAMAGELKEWSDSVPVGETITFTKDIFEGCDDANIQLLTKLLTAVENTCDSICNLNNIPFAAE
jgi:hypothetical protein